MTISRFFAHVSVAVLAVATVVSCGDDENSICVGDETVIVALSLESVWIYRVTDRDTANVLLDIFEDTIMIVKDTMIEGQPWFITSIEDELWVNRADGFWVWENFASDEIAPHLLAKFPAVLGQKYPIPVSDGPADTMKIADMLALVNVPYGAFEAITYQKSTPGDTVVSLGYYVRGIGKVREILIQDRGTNQILRTIELLKFTTAGC